MEAKITLSYENEREAEAIAKAVSPDNVKVPSGLFIKTVRRREKVLTLVRCKMRLQTFIATLDDFLCCASVAERALPAAKKS